MKMRVNLGEMKMAYVNAHRDIDAVITRIDKETIELEVTANDGYHNYATIKKGDERWNNTLKLIEGLEALGYWYTH